MAGVQQLLALPNELVVTILEELPAEDLLTCKLVCHELAALITRSPSLKYKIELACAGMEDNPEHSLSKTGKWFLLDEYQKAWSRVRNLSARQSNSAIVPIEDGPAWELAGGVLAQSVGMHSLRFKRIASKLRGIEEDAWDVDYQFPIRDFTMDPGQDLLVALREPQTMGDMYTLNLMSMSSPKPHPLAQIPALPLPFTRAEDFEIRINGSYVGLLVMHGTGAPEVDWWSPVFIWNWKTGRKVLALHNQVDEQEYVCSFAFLADRYVVLAHMTPPLENGALTVVELSDPSEDQDVSSEWASMQPRWTFLLPPCQTESSTIESMELLCDPGPQWVPNAQDAQPSEPQTNKSDSKAKSAPRALIQPSFFLARKSRIIILMMTVMDERSPFLDAYTIRFTISAAHLLAFIETAPNAFPLHWRDWGPESCRAEPQNCIWDGSWPCVVYGTRVATQHSYVSHTDGQVRRYRPVSLSPNEYEVFAGAVELVDFNQTAIARAISDARVVPPGESVAQFFAGRAPESYQDVQPLAGIDDGFDYYVHPTRLPPDFAKFFDDPDCVMTCLPYRSCTTRISMDRSENGTEAFQLDGVGLDDPPVDVGPFGAVMLSEDAIVVVREWPGKDPEFLIVSVQ